MNSLIKKYTVNNRLAIAISEMERRISILKKQTRDILAVRTEQSYAQITSRFGCKSNPVEWSKRPEEKKPPRLEKKEDPNMGLIDSLNDRFAVASCRRDFWRAVDDFKSRQLEADNLICHIAARLQSKKVFVPELIGEFRYNRTKIDPPRVVKRIPRTPRRIVKRPKEDWVRSIFEVRNLPFEGLKVVQGTSLFEGFSHTPAARVLFAGLLMRLAVLRPVEPYTPKGVKPQMDKPQAASTSQSVAVTVGNTKAYHEQSSTRVDDPIVKAEQVAPSKALGFYNMAASIERPNFKAFSERWIFLQSVEWNTTQVQGNVIWNEVMLPKLIKENMQSQVLALMMQHRFYRCDIRMRFSLTSNKFQTGCVVASALYTDVHGSLSSYNAVWTALQRNHVRLYAGADLNAELVIPYRYPDSTMCLLDKLGFASIFIHVLNPLATTSKTATSCKIAVYVTVENVHVNGLCARYTEDDIKPQMDTIGAIAKMSLDPSISNAVNVASTVLSTVAADNNRDNPPVPLQPMTFVPQGVGSFAYTNNAMEPLSVLRADAKGQVPHCIQQDDMSLKTLIRTWSFWKTFTITSATTGLIGSLPCVPLPDVENSVRLDTKDNMVQIIPSSLAFVSSFYSFYRGDIEIMMEFVMSSFHKAKIMVACVPYLKNQTLSLGLAKMSVNQTFDIQDPGEKIFVCPWQWRNAFCRMRSTAHLRDIPSTICFYIINNVIGIDGVPKNIYMNIFVRGGDNFELSIPRPTLFSCAGVDHIKPPSTQSPTPYNRESYWYLTYNTDCKRTDGKYPLVPYIQNVVNGFVGYTNLQSKIIYRVEKTFKGLNFRVVYKNNVLKYGTYDPALSTANAHGMIMAPYTQLLQYIAEWKKTNNIDKARDKILTLWEGDGDWSQVQNQAGDWVTATDKDDPPVWLAEVNNDTFEMVEAQMEEPTTVKLVKSSVSSNFGLKVFGEDCPDFKSASHRYEFLGSLTDVARYRGLPENMAASGEIRVWPIVRAFPNTSASWHNRNMEGSISTRARVFRGYRGSIRYRFVVIGNPPEGSFMFVSHLHDVLTETADPISSLPDIVRTRFDMLNTQYASHMQALCVNQVFTVEVPYYSEKEFLSLYDSDDRSFSDNGSLRIWVRTPIKADISLEVFYALGDDCRFYDFIGVPRCYDLSTMAVEPQMDQPVEIDQRGLFSKAFGFTKEFFSAPVTISEAVTKAAESHIQVVGDVRETLQKIKTLSSEFSEKVMNIFASATEQAQERPVENWSTLFGGLSSVTFEIVTHFMYAIIGGTTAVVCFAIFNLLRLIFKLSMSSLQKVSTFVSSIWSSFRSSTQPAQGLVEPQLEDADIVGYGTLLFTSISTYCGVKAPVPSNMSSLAKGLFCFSNSARQGSYVGKFLQDNITFIKRIFESFMKLFSVKDDDYELISGINDSRLRDWMIEVSFLVSPVNENSVMTNPKWIQKVFEMSMVGRAMALATTFSEVSNNRLSRTVQSYMKELSKLEESLVNRKVFSSVRYEPFSLWLSGPAGTSKTTLANICADHFAAAHNYEGVHTYHPMSAGQKYMDGLMDQPTIFIDDALSTDLSTDTIFVALMLNGKSSSVLRLPFSKTEDKDRLCNFQNMIFSSNFSYFNNIPGIHDTEAYNRRRDLLLRFEFGTLRVDGSHSPDKFTSNDVKSYLQSGDPLKIKFIEEMEHLRLYVCDPLDETQKEMIPKVEGKPYRDSVLEKIMHEHTEYHKGESRKYQKRYRVIHDRLAATEMSGLSFEAQLLEYKKVFASREDNNTDVSFLDKWLTKSRAACGESIIEPQSRDPEIIAYLETVNGTKPAAMCLHLMVDRTKIIYNSETKWFVDPEMLVKNDIRASCRNGPCMTSMGDEYEDCIFRDPVKRQAFLRSFLYSGMHYDEVQRYRCSGVPRSELPGFSLTQEMCDLIPVIDRGHDPSSISILESAQSQIKSQFKRVGSVLLGATKAVGKITVVLLVVLIKAFELMWNILENIGLVVLGLIGVAAIFSAFCPERGVEAQIHPSGDYSTVKSNARTIRHRTVKLCTGATPNIPNLELTERTSSIDGVIKKISGNTTFIAAVYQEDGLDRVIKARCIGLHSKTVLMLKHYYDFFKSKDTREVYVISKQGDCNVKYELSELKFTFSDECGYGLCILPDSYPVTFKKITQLICSETFGGSFPSDMCILEHNLDVVHTRAVKAKVLQNPIRIPGQSDMQSWIIDQGFEYDWGGKGKCGSLLLIPTLSSPIVGIHSAGIKEARGFAELLRRETFEPEKNVIEFVEPNLDDRDNVYGLDGYYSQEGALDRDMVPHFGSQTQIRKSEIHGVFEPTTEPAPLSGKDERLDFPDDIFRIGVSRRCEPIKEFDSEHVRLAQEHYQELVLDQVKPIRTPVEPLTVKQAIEGLPIKGMAEPLQMSTSEGFPWRCLRPGNASNKSWLFKLSNYPDGRMRVDGIYSDLQMVLDHKMEQRKNGKIPCSYFTTCLKDARILKTKVGIPGKTRVFEMSPIDLTIAQRQYFYDYISSFTQSRFEHTIGINPDGQEWTDLANELLNFSPHILTADYSAYGPRLSTKLLRLAFDTATAWCQLHEQAETPEVEDRLMVRECLKNEVAHGLHIAKDLVFRPSSGLPSGNCETVNKNTECNSRYIRIAFLGLAKKYDPHYESLYWFTRMVKMFSNGDDLIMAVKPQIIGWFNNRTLIEFFGEYGLKMTDALKSGVVREYCSLEEATYLKRGFLPHPKREGHWLAPLEKASITDTANWVWNSADLRKASLENSEMSCRLAYTHGPEFYEEVANTIKAKWAEIGVRFEYPDWSLLDNHIWEGREGPKYYF